MTTAEARSDDHWKGLHQLPPSGRSWLVFFLFYFLNRESCFRHDKCSHESLTDFEAGRSDLTTLTYGC
jgi:hypothetical protein